MDWSGSGKGQVSVCCERGNEPLCVPYNAGSLD